MRLVAALEQVAHREARSSRFWSALSGVVIIDVGSAFGEWSLGCSDARAICGRAAWLQSPSWALMAAAMSAYRPADERWVVGAVESGLCQIHRLGAAMEPCLFVIRWNRSGRTPRTPPSAMATREAPSAAHGIRLACEPRGDQA